MSRSDRDSPIDPRLAQDERATAVEVGEGWLRVRLADGREVTAPLAWFGRVAGVDWERLERWTLVDDGRVIRWPELDDEIPVSDLLRKRGCLSSLFRHRRTAWVFGVVLPVVLMAIDPLVFRERDWLIRMPPRLPGLKALATTSVALGVLAMILALRGLGPRGWLAGALAAGAAFAAGLGCLLLPMSLIGMFFLGAGLLGLVPLGTAVVFADRARLAYLEAPASSRGRAAACGFLLFLAVPGGVNLAAKDALATSLEDLHAGTPERVEEASARLARWSFLVDGGELAERWLNSEDADYRDRLAAAYRRMTDEDILLRASRGD